jgi:hypothetical protein
MSERVTAERVKAFAAAARVPIQDDAAARAARAADATVRRMDELDLQLALEIEPASFVAIARGGAKR